MQALSDSLKQQYVQRIAAMLQTDFPAAFSRHSFEELSAFASNAMGRGSQYGIRAESDLSFLIRLDAIYGQPFESQPEHSWALDILKREDLAVTEKIDRIHDMLVFIMRDRA
jgi:hypothetical protein